MDKRKNELPSPLAEAHGSAVPTCDWVVRDTENYRIRHELCGKASTHRDPFTRHTYCAEHTPVVADIFGFDTLDAIQPNDRTERPALPTL